MDSSDFEQISKSINKNDLVSPEFPGGNDSLMLYIRKNLRFPLKSMIEGMVFLNFTVEKDGSLSNIKVIKSQNKELAEEAVRVVKSMPKWKPGEEDGKKVRVELNLPIRFTLR